MLIKSGTFSCLRPPRQSSTQINKMGCHTLAISPIGSPNCSLAAPQRLISIIRRALPFNHSCLILKINQPPSSHLTLTPCLSSSLKPSSKPEWMPASMANQWERTPSTRSQKMSSSSTLVVVMVRCTHRTMLTIGPTNPLGSSLPSQRAPSIRQVPKPYQGPLGRSGPMRVSLAPLKGIPNSLKVSSLKTKQQTQDISRPRNSPGSSRIWEVSTSTNRRSWLSLSMITSTIKLTTPSKISTLRCSSRGVATVTKLRYLLRHSTPKRKIKIKMTPTVTQTKAWFQMPFDIVMGSCTMAVSLVQRRALSSCCLQTSIRRLLRWLKAASLHPNNLWTRPNRSLNLTKKLSMN